MTTKAQWAELGIYNSYHLAKRYAQDTGGYGVYLAKSVNDGTRVNMGTPHGWIVMRPGFKTNPDATDYRDQNKIFSLFNHHNWDAALAAAAQWMTARYQLRQTIVLAIPGFGGDRFPVEIEEWAKTYPKTAPKKGE